MAHNTSNLHEAVITCLMRSGWGGLSTRSISSAAGLSHGSIYARFGHVNELIGETWQVLIWPEMRRSLDAALDGLADDGDETQFVEAVKKFVSPTPTMLAGIELLQASLVEPDVAAFTSSDITMFLEKRTDPARAGGEVRATVAATAMYLAIGLLLLARRTWTQRSDPTAEIARYFRALRTPTDPLPTPDMIAEYLYKFVFDLGDERLDRLFLVAVTSIGEVGYRSTTIARICRRAGVSSGFVMARFKTKAHLLRRITEEMWGRGLEQIGEYIAEMTAAVGPEMAEALAWREMQDPAIARVAILSIETARAATFDSSIADIVEGPEEQYIARLPEGVPLAYVHSEYAIGNGMILLGCLRPELRLLPFSCVTTPLVTSAPR